MLDQAPPIEPVCAVIAAANRHHIARPEARGNVIEDRADRGALPNLHSFRHSAASEAISAGESVEEVSWQLGHRNSVVTRTVYLQQVRDAERQARRRAAMEERYGGDGCCDA